VTAFRSPTTASAFTESIPGSTFLACHFASLHSSSQARSAFCSTAAGGSPRLRPSPRFCPSPACCRARSASPPASTPLQDSYVPPDQSVLPDSLPISPPSGYARSPVTPRSRLSITSRWKRINAPSSLRFRRLAVPQTALLSSSFGDRVFDRSR